MDSEHSSPRIDCGWNRAKNSQIETQCRLIEMCRLRPFSPQMPSEVAFLDLASEQVLGFFHQTIQTFVILLHTEEEVLCPHLFFCENFIFIATVQSPPVGRGYPLSQPALTHTKRPSFKKIFYPFLMPCLILLKCFES